MLFNADIKSVIIVLDLKKILFILLVKNCVLITKPPFHIKY